MKMNAEQRATCHALAGRAEELAVKDITLAARRGKGDSDARAITGEQIAWFAQTLTLDDDARILFNMLVMQLRASAQPDYGWRRCATLGGKGHLWNPAPGAVPPRSTDGLPDVTCPHHAKQAQPVPDLPGAIGAGAKYGAAMVELARAAMVRRGAEAFYEEAKLGEEIAQEEVQKAKAALDAAAQGDADA